MSEVQQKVATSSDSVFGREVRSWFCMDGLNMYVELTSGPADQAARPLTRGVIPLPTRNHHV